MKRKTKTLTPGARLRQRRLRLGMTLREVEIGSRTIAARLKNRKFVVPASRVHDFEDKGVVPSIHRLYTLSRIYSCDLAELLHWYGVPRL